MMVTTPQFGLFSDNQPSAAAPKDRRFSFDCGTFWGKGSREFFLPSVLEQAIFERLILLLAIPIF
jgi:hypothetical protein